MKFKHFEPDDRTPPKKQKQKKRNKKKKTLEIQNISLADLKAIPRQLVMILLAKQQVSMKATSMNAMFVF